MMFTTEDKLREVERELKLRRRLYPHWIEIGKIEAGDAKRRIEVMQAIADDLREAGAVGAPFMIDAETIQILLDLLNPLHGSLDIQVTEQFTDERELDPPKDREYAVNVTWQNERDLTQAVMILEKRKAGLAAVASVLLEWRDARAAFLACVDTVPHEDQGIPADLSRRFVDAEEKLFEVANEILML
jgi:hypothetical protein